MSIVAGIFSLPLSAILLFIVAISQMGSQGTSETFNSVVFISLITLTAALGCRFIINFARGFIKLSLLDMILAQIACGIILYVALSLLANLIIGSLADSTLYNSNRSPTIKQQAIDTWMAPIGTLLFQHLVFWRLAVTKKVLQLG